MNENKLHPAMLIEDNGIRFLAVTVPAYEDAVERTMLFALAGMEVAPRMMGYIVVPSPSSEGGFVDWVEVMPGYEGDGIATDLVKFAEQLIGRRLDLTSVTPDEGIAYDELMPLRADQDGIPALPEDRSPDSERGDRDN